MEDLALGVESAIHGVDTIAGMSDTETRRITLLVYSSSESVRNKVRTALGTRPAPGVEIEIVEAGTGAEVVARCDEGGIDVALLDGEAAPTGGLGLCRQLKDELDDAPPVLVLVGRRDDAWLATWCRAEGVVQHPVDAMQITDAVLALVPRAGAAVATGH
jgi:DNA-binding NarL/FixJ family response regulator